ncbi:MAG: hypothetical protein JST28_09115 [Acidobacteria bacterium]|nr:hypothetical protein [Acidobacteriota bacterium]
MNPETDLTTLAAVKAFLPIANTNSNDDATITALIKGCSADFLRATNRPDLLEADYIEVRQGDGGYRICLFHWPIGEITTLTVGGIVVPESADKIAPGYYFDNDIDPERSFNLYLVGQPFIDNAAVKIEYTAGYSSTPFDISQAVAEWVAQRYKQRPNLGTQIQRGAEGESLQQTEAAAPANTLACIERYKRRIPSVSRRYDEEQSRSPRGSVPGVFGRAR